MAEKKTAAKKSPAKKTSAEKKLSVSLDKETYAQL